MYRYLVQTKTRDRKTGHFGDWENMKFGGFDEFENAYASADGYRRRGFPTRIVDTETGEVIRPGLVGV